LIEVKVKVTGARNVIQSSVNTTAHVYVLRLKDDLLLIIFNVVHFV